jgi:hypothetical protein
MLQLPMFPGWNGIHPLLIHFLHLRIRELTGVLPLGAAAFYVLGLFGSSSGVSGGEISARVWCRSIVNRIFAMPGLPQDFALGKAGEF